MNLYVIGPITGIENENKLEFARVCGELICSGKFNSVIYPHLFIPSGIDWNIAMTLSIGRMMRLWNDALNIKTERTDFGIAMLDGWQNSDGAMLEHEIAIRLGIPCKPWREWL